MATMMKRGALAAAAGGEEPGEAAENETPDYEAREEADPSLEQGEPGESQETDDAGEGGEEGGQQAVDPRLVEAVQLVVARAQDALVQMAQDLDAAIKADPIRGTVEFGVRALRGVAQAAEQAGKPLPLDVVVNAGIALIQIIGTIANDKGYLADEDIDAFLKESFQQSVQAYAKMDMQDGRLKPRDVSNVMMAMNGRQGVA